MTGPYDALLFVSFGGPEGPEQVIPFLQRVTAGRNVPEERLRLVGQHYFDRGGVSPINDQCRDLIRRLEAALADADLDLPVYWGNRNSEPFLESAIRQMAGDGVQRAMAFITSAYSSYSGCRQYRENLAAAREAVGPGAPDIDKLRVYFNHPGFIEPLADRLATVMAEAPAATHVFFTAHSIPMSMAENSAYVAQLENAVELIRARVPVASSSLVWQSRSGPPTMPWLEPDIVDSVNDLAADTAHVVIVPVGFVSDHMEVIQDLDTDARRAVEARGMTLARVETSGTDPRFIEMIVDLVRERVDGATPVALGDLGLVPDQCSTTCCPAPQRPAKPASAVRNG
ncbi:MAG: ferrochelatase [Actinomycetota bacterium]